MTSKEKVMRVHARAEITVDRYGRGLQVLVPNYAPGHSLLLGEPAKRASWAWANAWRVIQEARKWAKAWEAQR